MLTLLTNVYICKDDYDVWIHNIDLPKSCPQNLFYKATVP